MCISILDSRNVEIFFSCESVWFTLESYLKVLNFELNDSLILLREFSRINKYTWRIYNVLNQYESRNSYDE